jgi:hypothetical protein
MAKSINSASRKKQDSTEKNHKDIKIDRTGAKQEKVEAGRKQRLALVQLQQKLESARNAPKPETAPENRVAYYIGIDLGEKNHYCFWMGGK